MPGARKRRRGPGRRAVSRRCAGPLVALGLVGCGREASPVGLPSVSATARPTAAAPSVRAPAQAPLKQELADVPGGKLIAGSRPGTSGRRPELEPRRYEVELGSYQIDRLPFPNDPGAPPLRGVTRVDAERRCAERGGRLCTELEWERACKGPDNDEYVSGASWEPSCGATPLRCASAFEVLGLTTLREWTASDVVPSDSGLPRRAAVRGAPAAAPPDQHRCARRESVDPATTSDDLGFRCCRGAPNAAKVREPAPGATFTKQKLDAARIERLLADDPRTAWLARDVKLFREPEAARTVVGRGPGDEKGFSFTVAPLRWNPAPGVEFLLITARSGADVSFVAAYHVVGEDEYALAASFAMKREPGPVAFAYSGSIRPRLHFSNCWGCPGETGKLLFREPETVVILQP